jgi:hypothetical protein
MANLANKTLPNAVGAVSGFAVVFCVALLFGKSGNSGYRPGWELELGASEQIRMVFLVSSTCGANDRVGFEEAIRTAQQSLAERFTGGGRQFVSTGVFVDWQLEKGIDFLGGIGDFDEVIIGGSWLNSGAIRYIWRDYPGASALPQVIVAKRAVTVARNTIGVGEEELLLRLVGAEAIMRWVELGMPIEVE